MGGGWLPLQKKPPASVSTAMDVSSGAKVGLGYGPQDRKDHRQTGHSSNPWGGEDDDWYLILEDDAEVDQSVITQELQIEINKLIHQKVPSTFDVL